MFDIKMDPNEFFNKVGLSSLSPEEKEKRFAEMMEVVEMRVFEQLMEILDEEEQEKFNSFETEDEAVNFLKEKNIDLNVIAMEEGQKYREELINDMAEIESGLTNNK